MTGKFAISQLELMLENEECKVPYETIKFEFENGIARLTLNRPERLNALCDSMFPEIQAALDTVQHDPLLRVLVITGSGRGFCAGADLISSIGQGETGQRDIGATLERNYNPLIRRLRSLRVPVLGVVNGVAAGAGASLALACDVTIACRSARFVLAFARIGLVPDAGATYFLPQKVGHARASGLALLGEEVSAMDAANWGMIWRCVEDEDLVAEAERLAQHFAHAPTQAIALTKAALQAAARHSLDEQLDLERRYQAEMGSTHDFGEGVAAFREKRPTKFIGR